MTGRRLIEQFINSCLADIADPESHPKRKRRAIQSLGYWATELESKTSRVVPYDGLCTDADSSR